MFAGMDEFSTGFLSNNWPSPWGRGHYNHHCRLPQQWSQACKVDERQLRAKEDVAGLKTLHSYAGHWLSRLFQAQCTAPLPASWIERGGHPLSHCYASLRIFESHTILAFLTSPVINKLYSILACSIPEKATWGATGTKSGDFNEKEECSHRDSNLGPLASEADTLITAPFDPDYHKDK